MNDIEIYSVIRQIADFIMKYANKKDFWMEDRRNEEINPFYHQTQQGIFLEIYYSLPNTLWTPWGDWGFGGSGNGWWENITPEIIKTLNASLYAPLKTNVMGQFGPIYAIHSFQGKSLPQPILRDQDNFLCYDDAKRIWKNLTGDYKN